ncbi:MAG: carbohydrate ABC transporter permease [Oscillospiraceae bacterium]
MSRFSNKNIGALNFMDMRRPGNKAIYWGIFALLFLLALVCILPPLWVMLSSFKTTKEIMNIPPILLPTSYDFSKFIDVWNLLHFEKFYINTLLLAAGSVVSAILFNGIAGYVLSCLKPRGTAAIMTAVMWTMLLPNTLSMVPLFKNFVSFPIFGFNLTNTFWPMWICAGANAFNILLFKDFFDGIPLSLTEAAQLDGCGRLGIFTRIILPLSKPILSVVAIFTVNGTWGDFLLPFLVLSDRSKYTVMIQIYNTKTTLPIDQQLVSLIYAIIPPIIIFFFFQKSIMGGITLGGVKE